MTQMMRDVVRIQGGFKPSVQLPRDYFHVESNRHFVENFIPTQETLEIFLRVRDSLQPNSENRTKLLTGTYGTGKSDLMLMIANYVTRPANDPLLSPFFERLRNLDSDQAATIYNARLGKPPFLLVLLQADTASTFTSFVLDGLEKALTQIGRADVLGKTYYRAALDRIAQWQREHPENIERLEKELLATHECTLTQLKHDLAGLHADAALSTFRTATLRAIGLPFHETTVVERPYEAFEIAAEGLVKSGKYSGIFVIADEFTHLLQKLAESATASPDIKAIDDLAVAADRSGKHELHFYVVSLRGFASAKASTHTSQTALERSGGRFIQGQVELRSQYMEELIRASIVKQVPPEILFTAAPKQLDELISLAMRLWGSRPTGKHDREWVSETVVKGCFPLHPLTTYCLPFLNRALAQNERTMFSFLWDEQHGLKSFIDKVSIASTDEWISLVPLDYLFDYFEISLKERRPDIYLLCQQAQAKLLPEQVSTGLEGRLLRALVLLEIVSGDSNLRTDRDSLRHALGLPLSHTEDVSAALQRLEQTGVAYPNQAGYYLLVKQGHANPSELRNVIERRAQDIVWSPINTLNEHYKPSDVSAVDYNKARGTERKLSATFMSIADLRNTSLPLSQLQNNEGLLWYVVARTEEERLQARSAALQLTKQYDQLAIAVPLDPTDILERLKCTIAVDRLRNSEDYNRPDYQELLADNGLVGGDYLSAFERERQKFENCAVFEWNYEGRTTNIQTPMHLEALATKIMKTAFPSTPAHSTSQHLSKNLKSTSKLKEALDQILNAPFRRASGKKSATDAILSDGAGLLGLIYITGHEGGYNSYDVCVPDQRDHRLQNSKSVWDILEEQLRNNAAWPNIFQQLKDRPYGLYSSVLALFLATFLHYNRDFVDVSEVKYVLDPIGVTGDIIIKMVESPRDYVIRYQPLTNLQGEFLRGIVRILLPHTEFRSQRSDAASLRNQVAKLLLQKIKDISLVYLPPSLDELTEVLPDIPQETLTMCQQLIEVGQLPDEAARTAALLETLPRGVGLPADCANWTDKDVRQALSDLESAYRQLQQLPKRLRQSITLQIGQWFGVAELPKHENEVLEAAHKWRKATGVRLQDLTDQLEAQDVLKLLDDEPYSFEQVFLNALPARWKLRTIGEWQTLRTKNEYLDRLEKAKQAIEDLASILSSSVSGERTADSRSVSLPAASLIESKTSGIEPRVVSAPSGAGSSATNVVLFTSTESTQSMSTTAAHRHVYEIPQTVDTSLPTSANEPRSQEKKRYEAEQAVGGLSSQNNMTKDVMEHAFEVIQSIIESLSPKDQIRLWERLVEEYDPR